MKIAIEASLDGIDSEISLAEAAIRNYEKAIADGETALDDYRMVSEDTRQAIENLARRTRPIIEFDGVDITGAILPYLLSVTYTDNEEYEADDLTIKL